MQCEMKKDLEALASKSLISLLDFWLTLSDSNTRPTD
jgi:hypothetical protein